MLVLLEDVEVVPQVRDVRLLRGALDGEHVWLAFREHLHKKQ